MGLQEKLVKIEGKSAWSFFGFILAIIFGAIAVYTTFLEDRNPNLQFIAENSTQVLDLNENIKNLDILYKGINIKEQDKNLSIVTLKIKMNMRTEPFDKIIRGRHFGASSNWGAYSF